ncbi:MAG TPA: MraY family glycosyltransferase, partial [Isosphaeraceae bacterium]|nr:MraY family glycosyltransferase [Isosphaeraceae bacterium]
VSRIAAWVGAIDKPDQFRRIHKGAVPRMGGLALAFGLALCTAPVVLGGYLREWAGFEAWWTKLWAVLGAGVIVLIVGVIDDSREMRPKIKLLGQSIAVLILFVGGIRIDGVVLLGLPIPLSFPIALPLGDLSFTIDPVSFLVSLFWFLACMNIWNLIDGMDGLASGVGMIVSSTLMLVAIHQQNYGSAVLAAGLSGCLAGFLLYNWHPACIFLGDSGSLLIGLLIGVIGVQDSLKGTTAVSILFPILAMGLPISDTAMAIFRRWVRNLPLSSADRQHVHHMLIGLGLGPRKAALILYFFTAGLCGVVLMGVAWHNEFLALLLGLSGCLAFLLILTSRRDELAGLAADLQTRRIRKKQEQIASKITWEIIQRIELCDTPEKIWDAILRASRELGSDRIEIHCQHEGRTVLQHKGGLDEWEVRSGPTASFRLYGGQDIELSVSLHQGSESLIAADISFRSLQRLCLASAQRLERLLSSDHADGAGTQEPSRDNESLSPTASPVPVMGFSGAGSTREALGWLRVALGWGSAPR